MSPDLAEAQKLSHTGSWAWSPNPDSDIRYWSEECYRVLGFDPTGIGLPAIRRILSADSSQMIKPRVAERFEKAIREKADFEL